jgi:hypothetical protein
MSFYDTNKIVHTAQGPLRLIIDQGLVSWSTWRQPWSNVCLILSSPVFLSWYSFFSSRTMSSAVLRSLGANGWFQVLKQNSDGEKLGCCGGRGELGINLEDTRTTHSCNLV